MKNAIIDKTTETAAIESEELLQKERLKIPSWLMWTVSMLALLAWAIGLGIVSLYLAKVSYGKELFFSFFDNSYIIILNILPIIWLTFFFWLLTNRIWGAVLGSGLITISLSLIHYFKLLWRNDPLIARDIYFIKEGFSAGSKFKLELNTTIILIIAVFIIATLTSFFLLRVKLKRKAPRFISLALLFVLGGVLLSTVYHNYGYYQKTENYEVELYEYKISPWSSKDQFCTRGFAYPLLYSTKDLSESKPRGYNKSEIAEEISSFEASPIAEDKKVNIISVMLEAYSDLSEYDIDFIEDPYEFFHELQEESISGSLIANVFAGGTVNTERAFLTGHTNEIDYRANADSFVRYLKSQGYYTEFAHPVYNWFYNRQNVMEYLGFDASYFYEDRYYSETPQYIFKDHEFFPDLIELYEQAQKPYFNFSLTYQNHGPYASTYFDSDVRYINQSKNITDDSYVILNNYFDGIAKTDRALSNFIDYFRNQDEPVVLVFFGDHKPWLGDDSFIYREIGAAFDSKSGFENQYETPYIIWANSSAKKALDNEFVGEGKTVSPSFLMSLLFDELDFQGDRFMQINRELREALPVIHSATGYFLQDGELTKDISDSANAILEKHLQYEFYRYRNYK
ncbi:sulfatase-like hydrolase/transferase [Clostridiaceae bacterium OttesenSCG-928-D20]|nr:sulfatase-like hydrolase/transferase [Clostridiaceae bacterium OttesenSCG-928-D20]